MTTWTALLFSRDDVKKIKVGEVEVGLIGLDVVFEEIRKLALDGKALKDELLQKVKLYNWVAEGQENEYKATLFEAYKSFCDELNRR